MTPACWPQARGASSVPAADECYCDLGGTLPVLGIHAGRNSGVAPLFAFAHCKFNHAGGLNAATTPRGDIVSATKADG
jgi:hypothetical protein